MIDRNDRVVAGCVWSEGRCDLPEPGEDTYGTALELDEVVGDDDDDVRSTAANVVSSRAGWTSSEASEATTRCRVFPRLVVFGPLKLADLALLLPLLQRIAPRALQ